MNFPTKAEIEATEEENPSVFDDYQDISLNETPTESRWALPAMYRISQTQGTLYWRIGFDGETNELVTEHGYFVTATGHKGAMQVDRLKLYTNNLHKVILTKAIQDAQIRYSDKYKEGYSDQSGNSIDLPQAQLANTYAFTGQPSKGKGTLKPIHFQRGVAVQAKLDGIRARAWMIGDEIKIYSREFNLHPWLDVIKEELRELFKCLPKGVGIDGELWNPDLPFEQLTSVVKTFKSKHPLNDTLGYYIFDLIWLETDFETRSSTLNNCYVKATGIKSLPHINILANTIIHQESDIKLYHDAYVNQYHFEGLILRKTSGQPPHKATSKKDIMETWYKPKRNNNLLKVKAFIDEEGTVVDITSGEGRESNLAIIHIKDIRGNVFPVRPRGSFENRQKWLLNKGKYIGKRYTFRYFELSDYSVPRFPVGIAFRDYE